MFIEWCCALSFYVFFLERCSSPILWGSIPYIVHSIASQPFICTSLGNNLDIFPVKTLLEVVKKVLSCEVIVQVSFPYKCDQFNWCSALNVEVVVTFPDISPFCCLHDSVIFSKTLLSSVESYIKYFWGAFAVQDSRSADQFAFSPQTSHSQLLFVSEWSWRLSSSNLVHVSDFG